MSIARISVLLPNGQVIIQGLGKSTAKDGTEIDVKRMSFTGDNLLRVSQTKTKPSWDEAEKKMVDTVTDEITIINLNNCSTWNYSDVSNTFVK